MSDGGVAISVEHDDVTSPDAIEKVWRALEPQASGLSIFQSWCWTGCLFAERFDDPVLLRAVAEGRVVGLALFNRAGRRLVLAGSGDAVRDAPFIEHNAPLVAAGWEAAVTPALFEAAWRLGARRIVLPGVAPALIGAAHGSVVRMQEQIAPFVDLAVVRAAGGDHLSQLSANARQQLRRVMRYYAARGTITVTETTTAAEAAALLDALIVLHGQTWQRRGKPGAFATDFMRRFHHDLVARALAEGTLDLLRVDAAGAPVGYLYGFRLGGRVSAYQSGFAYEPDGPTHARPGLLCHALAIARALARGDETYDFLAGADRYKRSLANGQAALAWAELAPRGSMASICSGALRRLRRLVRWGDSPAG